MLEIVLTGEVDYSFFGNFFKNSNSISVRKETVITVRLFGRHIPPGKTFYFQLSVLSELATCLIHLKRLGELSPQL